MQFTIAKRKANHHRATTDTKHKENDYCKTNNKQNNIAELEQKTEHNCKTNSETAMANQNETKKGLRLLENTVSRDDDF